MKNFYEYYRFRIGKSGKMLLYCNERMDSMSHEKKIHNQAKKGS